MADAFATVDDGRSGCATCTSRVSPRQQDQPRTTRNRKLLLHRSQIDTLVGKRPRWQPHPGAVVAVLQRGPGQGRTRPGPEVNRPTTNGQDLARRDAEREVVASSAGVPRHVLIGVLLALAAAIGYGVSDFVGGIASRRVAALRVVLISYPVAMVLLACWAVWWRHHLHPRRSCGARCAESVRPSECVVLRRAGFGPISVVSP